MSDSTEEGEIVAQAPCPHCTAAQYFTAWSLGRNVECIACGATFGAPKTTTGYASATPWPPPPEPVPIRLGPEPAPIQFTGQTRDEYLKELRTHSSFRSARAILIIVTSIGTLSTFVAIAMWIGRFGIGPATTSGEKWVVLVITLLVFVMIGVLFHGVYRFLSVILDIADALVEQGRRK